MKFLTLLATLLAPLGLNAADAKPAYPLTTCLVSGEKLGGMGALYVFTYEGREIQLCCEHCKATFEKDPAKYLKVLDNAGKTH